MDTRTWTEAPASATIRFALGGYDTMLTLRDDAGKELLDKVQAAISYLDGLGAQANGGNGGNGASGAPVCPTHGKPMKKSKFGGWYCPVKVADDDGTGKPVYCKQKVGA